MYFYPLPLQVLGCDNELWSSTLAQAYDYAARMGAHIVSVSIGSNLYQPGFIPIMEARPQHKTFIRRNLAVSERLVPLCGCASVLCLCLC